MFVRVGFVGLGAMGSPMAERLLGAHLTLDVYARRSEVAERFVSLGAHRADSLPEVAAQADVVVVCVLTDEQVADVALGAGGLLASMREGAVLVVHTTGSPATAEHLAGVGAARGVSVVDAPVSGTADQIRAGAITLLVGGDPEALEKCAPVLAAYGDPILRLGALGNGQRVKLVNNILLAANLQVGLAGLRVGEALGIDAGEVARAIVHCSGGSYALNMIARSGSAQAVIDGAGRFLRKDIDVATKVASELGIDLGFAGHVAEDGPASFGAPHR